MGTSLGIQAESWGAGDQSWIKHRKGFDDMRSITLEPALFAAEHKVGGIIKSGILLGQVTATLRYGPYSPLLSNGLQTPAGFLFFDAKVVGSANGVEFTRVACALFWEGIIDSTRLPQYTTTGNLLGELDAAAITALTGRFRIEAY